MRKIKKIGTNFIVHIILFVIMLITIYPIVYTVGSSFKTNAEILTEPARIFPKVWTLDNYREIFTSEYFNGLRMLWNSVYYTVINVIITLVMSAVSAYVFERGHFPFKNTIFTVFLSLMFVSLGSVTMYPIFDMLNVFKLANSLNGLLVFHFFGVGVVNVTLVRSYINTLPMALDESAKIDGCSFVGIFFRIIAPLLKPILATVGILAFQASWNDYLMPALFTMSNPQQQTLIVGITQLKNTGSAASSWNLMLAGSVITMIPVLIAYAIGNKFIIAGLVKGAVKG